MAILNLTNTEDPLKQILECLNYFKKIEEESKSSNEVVFDLSNIKWILPCTSLLLSHKIESLLSSKRIVDVRQPTSLAVSNHLKQIGFPLGSSSTKEKCCPIVHFSNNVDENVNKLLEFTDKAFPDFKEYENALKYILSELSTNISEHSKYTHATLTAQYYKTKQMIDMGVVDDGITIPGNFAKNNIQFKEDCEAIECALKGVTTKKNEEGRGKGLSSIEKLKNGLKGEMYIVSRKGVLVTGHEQQHKLYILKNEILNGTLVYLRFHKPGKNVDIYKYI